MITDVETVAFRADILEDGSTSDVSISKNSTPMSNEMLAHRIGLLPIHVKEPLSWDPEKYTFNLDVTNDSTNPLDVTAADIKVFRLGAPEDEPVLVPNVNFFHPDPTTKDTALLAVLKGKVGTQESESIAFTARATLGTGRENVRFMPVTSICSYGYTLDEDPDRRKEFFTRWLSKNNKGNPAELESDSVKKGELEREFATMEIQRCYKLDEKGEPNSFDFVIESMGVLDPVYIVGRALDAIQAKLLPYTSIDIGDLPQGLKIAPADAQMKGFDFVFQKEDHTLGNLLQTWIEQNLIDTEEVTYVGYKVPHPLRDEMLLRVAVEDGLETTARAAIAKAARELGKLFQMWRGSWSAVSI
jgi:DNA-directed RNA polymerase subunit L